MYLENGVYKYSESIDFEVLSISVSINGEPVVVYDLASGEELPSNVVQALFDDKVIKWAHNAIFERICLSEWLKRTYPLFYKQYGRSNLNPTCWRCTMVLGVYYGLPASLNDMGKALKLENQKLEEGKKLVKNFCQPCKPTSGNNYRTRNLPAHNPDEWKLFLEYNRRDVEVALEIKAILSKYQLPQNFWQEYALDQEINDRGILVDTNSVSNAVRFCEQYMADTTTALKNLTGIDNPNSIQQMKAWLESKDIKVASLDKNAVDALMLTVPADIKTILTLYRKMKKTSVAKYTKMFNARGRDGRIRGAFQFYGAKLKLTICYQAKTKTNNIEFRYQDNILFITLPSGRELCYRNPKIELGELGQEITYDDAKIGVRVKSYGAKFVENIVQGISRDILANAMMRLQSRGAIIAHVHDEVVLECHKSESVDKICELMSIPPDWMPDINLKVEGFESMYYRK